METIVQNAPDRAAFIQANTRLLAVPHAPELSLYLADEAVPLWLKTEEELEAEGLPPPFWAFAWAGGQALARYILDRPGLVAGRRVLDFASGSGIVAIAAARSGAAHVLASEVDAFAVAAIAMNAMVNGVAVEAALADVIDQDGGWDVVLAGDVCYERPLAERITAWLGRLAARGAVVLIGDPGRYYLPKDRLEKLAEYSVPTSRALEDAEIKRTAVWTFTPPATPPVASGGLQERTQRQA
ncbi:class I SAM-dependent methyltransferase [Zavarzinia sp. CC-PAN008]|uniref:class I SAM-dependent methyltransferase n=1 Tax=Zavarzinia sp. CC-PAN008 TaxID=3243332 RepID=UPI003F742970